MRPTNYILRAAWILGSMLTANAPACAAGVVEFYIDPDFAGAVQNGSAANPWTHLDSTPEAPTWTEINRALATNDVAVYFPARGLPGTPTRFRPMG